ncbi:MAG: hypothetical protein IKN76_03350, partial [Oscillospiraceae bacterium]|nr:hypothetical protein [Oscillospiraceae bacterium]
MEKKKKKTRSGARLLPALLVLMIGLGALAWIGYSRYTMFEGEILPRDTELLDLRGKDATEEKIAAAREALPNARVLYDVTIAGKTYSCGEKEIVTGDFTVGDIPLFSRFEGLESVDASECSDLEAIRALREALPGAEVVWTVPLSGQSIPGEETDLTLEEADAGELAAALRRLPELRTVTVNTDSLTPEEQTELSEEFEGIVFRWPVRIPGGSAAQDAGELSFAGQPLSEEDLSALNTALALLPKVEKIDFTDTG